MDKFLILIDTAEQIPWTFRDMPGEGHVPTKRKYLGTRKDGVYVPRADYSVSGFLGKLHVERKSQVDCQQTILGFNSGRRKRFERELDVLSEMPLACVIVECSLGWMVSNPQCRGHRGPQAEMRTLHRTVLSWQTKYPVPWFFCDTRRFAEITAYRFLQRGVKKLK